jgi:hypothetical protein
MKKPGLNCLVFILGAASCFWLYGIGRTLKETVGFNLDASIVGLIIAVLPFTLLIALILITNNSRWLTVRASKFFGVALLAGSLSSELWLIHDERMFVNEITSNSNSTPHSRARAWPNTSCSLVFLPENGVHATD